VKGKLANGVGSQSPSHRFTLPRNLVYPALLPLLRTLRLPVVGWTDATADLNGLVRFVKKTKSGFCACAITFQTHSSNGYFTYTHTHTYVFKSRFPVIFILSRNWTSVGVTEHIGYWKFLLVSPTCVMLFITQHRKLTFKNWNCRGTTERMRQNYQAVYIFRKFSSFPDTDLTNFIFVDPHFLFLVSEKTVSQKFNVWSVLIAKLHISRQGFLGGFFAHGCLHDLHVLHVRSCRKNFVII